MANPLNIMRKRDLKERELSAYEMTIGIVQTDVHNRKEEFKTKLENYEKWKKENNIEGIKY